MSQVSSVAGPAKWIAVGVVASSSVGAALWAGFGRTPAPAPTLPPPIVLPALQPLAPANTDSINPALVARNAGNAPVARDPLALMSQPQDLDSAPRDAHTRELDTRALIVPASPKGPAMSEGEAPRPLAIPVHDDPGSQPAAKPEIQPAPQQPALHPAAPPSAAPKTPPPAAAARTINVNTATQAELELLPDVGPALAKRIIAYRAKPGGIKDLKDLDNVRGIGPKTLEKLKDRLRFSESR